ncbi:response regulator transcription factor [Kineosporia rhizophila]|uniref:response regulator transcription factor n=1 Tax=Kineosporia TaxID=49184 RepID=UPI001E6393C1|nr:response regulator transcription factor [Kineosporia sp. NBRC 101677]MCE0535519.1 response regulator transcription factor [Kineosporia rhizophila]GLY16689.1 DNA-binding response regulator [Kineosporia sp. NBRC 101677]
MSEASVLLAEDDPRQAEVVRRYLTDAGYDVQVTHDGATALNLARTRRPDLVVLDVLMPGLDGLSVCRRLREISDVPILMLTALSQEDDLLTGLDVGADDYMTKPFSPRELTARVRTLLRRAARHRDAEPVLRVGPLVVLPQRHQAFLDGTEIDCTPGEFAVLAALASRPGSVLSRGQLLQHTAGLERGATERGIDMHVLNLRRKIEPDPRRPQYLTTVYGVGYRLGA